MSLNSCSSRERFCSSQLSLNAARIGSLLVSAIHAGLASALYVLILLNEWCRLSVSRSFTHSLHEHDRLCGACIAAPRDRSSWSTSNWFRCAASMTGEMSVLYSPDAASVGSRARCQLEWERLVGGIVRGDCYPSPSISDVILGWLMSISTMR